jgi:hypothetical protein
MAIRFDCAGPQHYPCGTTDTKLSAASRSLVGQISAFALVAAAGLLIAACGSSNTPSASSSSGSHSPSPSPTLISKVDACSLVTAADASTAAGASVASLSNGVPGACFYASSDGTASVIVFAQAYPDTTTADAVLPEQIAASFNNGSTVTNAKPVSGIGDKAVEFSTTTAAGNSAGIFVFKSNVVLMIVITPAPSSSNLEQLARNAVGKL